MNASSSGKARAASSSQPSESTSKRKRGIFQKELQHMMYGFGDDPNAAEVLGKARELLILMSMGIDYLPLPETVALVEDIVVEYVTDFAHKAQDIGSKRGKLSVEDFLYLVRKDAPKLNRCKELLSMQEELKQARKAFDVDEEKLAASLD